MFPRPDVSFSELKRKDVVLFCANSMSFVPKRERLENVFHIGLAKVEFDRAAPRDDGLSFEDAVAVVVQRNGAHGHVNSGTRLSCSRHCL